MTRQLHLLLVALLAGGVIAAGCGGDDDGGDGDGSPAATQTDGDGDAGAAGETGTGPNGETGPGPDEDAGRPPRIPRAAVKQAVAACKQGVRQNPQLSAGLKSDLEDVCEKAAKGDQESLREASAEVCVKIARETIPAGPARDQTLAACRQAGVGP